MEDIICSTVHIVVSREVTSETHTHTHTKARIVRYDNMFVLMLMFKQCLRNLKFKSCLFIELFFLI